MVSASRSFSFVLKAIGSHAPRRAHAAAAAAAALSSRSRSSLPLNATLLRRKAAATGGARCLSTEPAVAAPPPARGTLRAFVRWSVGAGDVGLDFRSGMPLYPS